MRGTPHHQSLNATIVFNIGRKRRQVVQSLRNPYKLARHWTVGMFRVMLIWTPKDSKRRLEAIGGWLEMPLPCLEGDPETHEKGLFMHFFCES